MMKLLNLKEWLTIEATASYLSILFKESVTEADVLRLGLDNHLALSVNFVNHARGKIGRMVKKEAAKWCVMSKEIDIPIGQMFRKEIYFNEFANLPDEIKTGLKEGTIISCPVGDIVDDRHVIQYTDEIAKLTGVWDLAMIGGERLDVEHRYQQLTGGPAVTLICLDGAFVKSPTTGEFASIQESFDDNEFQKGSSAHLERLKQHIAANDIPSEEADSMLEQYNADRKEFLEQCESSAPIHNYFPAGKLPDDSVLVVRTNALREFEGSLLDSETGAKKALASNERNSLLTIIAALCGYSKIDLDARGAAAHIARLTEKIGAPVSDDTVRRALEKVPDAMESRMK